MRSPAGRPHEAGMIPMLGRKLNNNNNNNNLFFISCRGGQSIVQ